MQLSIIVVTLAATVLSGVQAAIPGQKPGVEARCSAFAHDLCDPGSSTICQRDCIASLNSIVSKNGAGSGNSLKMPGGGGRGRPGVPGRLDKQLYYKREALDEDSDSLSARDLYADLFELDEEW